jgi:hypothetical protein
VLLAHEQSKKDRILGQDAGGGRIIQEKNAAYMPAIMIQNNYASNQSLTRAGE